MSAIWHCPVLGCAFTLDTSPPDLPPEGVLAGIFGPGVLTATWTHQHAQNLETHLKTHLKTHTLVEFMRTMNELRQQRDEALAALVAVSP